MSYFLFKRHVNHVYVQHMQVVVVDINEARVAAWNSDSLPIYEPGLKEVVQEALGRNLFFSTDVKKHCAEADIIFVRRASTAPFEFAWPSNA
jgi:UDP-glucose 6-dehydrogenase